MLQITLHAAAACLFVAPQDPVVAPEAPSTEVEIAESAPEPILSPQQLDELAQWIDETRAAWDVPGLGVAIVTSDGTLMSRGFGVRELGSNVAVDADTLFGIGSSTKAFTTLALARAIEDGKLDWSDKVEALLPGFALSDEFASRSLTVRDLVTHRSGLPRHDLMWYGRTDRTAADIVQGVRHLELNKELRETFQYNNLGFVIAAEVLREATEKSWAETLTSDLFPALGMGRSTLTAAAFLANENHATGHKYGGEKKRVAAPCDLRNIDLVGPAGSISSSANDMARWAQFHLGEGEFGGDELISSHSLSELHTPQTIIPALPNDEMIGILAVAHGWFVDSYRGHLRVHHGGNIDGYSAMVTLYPMDDLAVVTLANMNRAAVPEYVSRRVADVAFDLPVRNWSEGDLDERDEARQKQDAPKEDGTAPDGDDETTALRTLGTLKAHPTTAYAATYTHPAYGAIKIEVKVPLVGSSDSDTLVFHLGELTGELEHWHYETFRVAATDEFEESPLEEAMMRFETDVAGEIVALHIALESSVAPIRFTVGADDSMADASKLADFEGEYAKDGFVLKVALRGEKLTAVAEGQPTLALSPTRSDAFTVDDLDGFALHFQRSDNGEVDAVELRQPNGAFLIPRVQPTGDEER